MSEDIDKTKNIDKLISELEELSFNGKWDNQIHQQIWEKYDSKTYKQYKPRIQKLIGIRTILKSAGVNSAIKSYAQNMIDSYKQTYLEDDR
ncbi:hypothetical protein HQ545_01735 [Candidatus Woesearchaeota archaeon]|nr:hypothetical protein [Candidatus Woesearchaeota archaeon]